MNVFDLKVGDQLLYKDYADNDWLVTVLGFKLNPAGEDALIVRYTSPSGDVNKKMWWTCYVIQNYLDTGVFRCISSR